MAVSFIGGGNHRSVTGQGQTLSHKIISSPPRHKWDSLTTLMVIDTDCTGSCKSNYLKITTIVALVKLKLKIQHIDFDE